MQLLKRIFKWQVLLGGVLISLSTVGYHAYYSISRYARHFFIYLLGNIASVFIKVLLVTLIPHRLLSFRERRVFDIKRTYLQLLSEWLDYMRHLGDDFLYLFSWAVRTNPFYPAASAVIK